MSRTPSLRVCDDHVNDDDPVNDDDHGSDNDHHVNACVNDLLCSRKTQYVRYRTEYIICAFYGLSGVNSASYTYFMLSLYIGRDQDKKKALFQQDFLGNFCKPHPHKHLR